MGQRFEGSLPRDGDGEWRATHRVGRFGAPAWHDADPASAAAPPLAPELQVQAVETRVFGWTRVRCDNGWEAGRVRGGRDWSGAVSSKRCRR